jgi:hypothetical protein
MEEMNTGIYGGAFGLLERSTRPFAVMLLTPEGPAIGGPHDEGRFEEIARSHGYTLHRFFDDTWAVVALLAPPAPAFKNGPNCVKAAMGVVNASFTKMWKNSQGLLETRIGNLMDGAQWAGFSIAEVASYLATAEHETLGFSTMYETNWNSKKESNYDYFERMYGPNGDRSHLAQGMGNVTAGDGWHYRGRGYVNLTGKNIYNWANAQAMAGKLGPQFHQAYTVANDNINMYAEDHVLAGRIGALYLQYQWGVFNVQVTPGNFQAARQAVNPNEIAKVAKNVAGRASDFLAAIKNCK